MLVSKNATVHVSIDPWSPTLLPESYHPADFSSNPNKTPEPANQGVQGYLIITDRCAEAGLELKSAGAGLEIPGLDLLDQGGER